MVKKGRMTVTALVALTLTSAVVYSQVSGGSQATEAANPPSAVSLNIMLWGDQPAGINQVVSYFENETAKSLNTSLNIQWIPETSYADKVALAFSANQPVDLEFNAPWMNMTSLAAKGDYLRLNKYFDDPQFPALHKYFTKAMLQTNSFPGPNGKLGVYGVPLGQFFMDTPVIFYRQDLAKQLGIPEGKINSLVQLYKYYDGLKKSDPNMIPFVENAQAGYSATMAMPPLPNQYAAGVYPITYGNVSGNAYIKRGKLIASWLAGEDPTGLANKFPAPYNELNTESFAFARVWHDEGYTQSNPLTQNDATGEFTSGNAGSIGGTLSNYEQLYASLSTSVRGAKLGIFITNPAKRAMQPGVNPTTFQMWNYLCIPVTSHNAERTMAFLNWIFSSQANNNLFSLGIPHKDWTPVGNDRYSIPKGSAYAFPGYELTWNPSFVPIPSNLPKEGVKMYHYESLASSYFVPITTGFVFNPASVKVQEDDPDLSDLNNFEVPLDLGVVAHPAEALNKELQSLYSNRGLQSALKAIQQSGDTQLEAFLAAKAHH